MGIYRKLDSLADHIDIRDVNVTLVESLRFLEANFKCENAYWFQMGELGSSTSQALRGKSFDVIEEVPTGYSPFLSARPYDVKKIEEEFKMWNKLFPEGWESIKSPQFYKSSKTSYCLIPVQSKDLGSVVGHIALVKKGKNYEFPVEAIEACQSFISRQFTYSLQFLAAKSMSYLDILTPLHNQRYLSIALGREIHRAERYQRPFSILFFDVDNFKAVNDKHGHLVGSAIISELGKFLKDFIRESDYGFRFGGDEFVLLLAETGVEAAQLVAERLRTSIEERVFRVDGVEHQITVSIGVATCPDHGRTKEQILNLADRAMYYGKRTTKNTVYLAAS